MFPFLGTTVWGFPHIKIKKLPHFHFMFFDRYDIHIQAFLCFVNGSFIIFQSAPPRNYFKKYIFIYIYTQIIYTSIFQKMTFGNNYKTYFPKQWRMGLSNISNIFKFSDSQIWKILSQLPSAVPPPCRENRFRRLALLVFALFCHLADPCGRPQHIWTCGQKFENGTSR